LKRKTSVSKPGRGDAFKLRVVDVVVSAAAAFDFDLAEGLRDFASLLAFLADADTGFFDTRLADAFFAGAFFLTDATAAFLAVDFFEAFFDLAVAAFPFFEALVAAAAFFFAATFGLVFEEADFDRLEVFTAFFAAGFFFTDFPAFLAVVDFFAVFFFGLKVQFQPKRGDR
jgi:hypothetical protein